MRLQETFPIWHHPGGVRGARDAVRIQLAWWNLPVDRDLVVLLVSETVTNAVEHGGPPSSVSLTWDATTLNVSVRDAQPDSLPVVRAAADGDETGRGLAMVAALAERWGIEVGPTWKSFWFEVGRQPVSTFEAASYLLLGDEVEPV